MATVTINYCGMEGTGRNVTDAKQDAARKIMAALSGSYNPAVLECRGWTILLWRTPDAWYSRIIQQKGEPVTNSPSTNWEGDDREEAIRSARAHLAQLAWRHADGLAVPRTDEDVEIALDQRQRGEFLSWAGFQLAYRAARERGMSDTEAHQWACHHPVQPHGEQAAVAVG